MSLPLDRLRRALPFALPVMAGYVAIGIPCGILEAEVGIAPWMALLVSATFYTGAGQFMLSNLWLAGQGPLSIALSISFVNLRQLLYSAAFAPRMGGARRGLAALFALTLTDESFGVNADRFAAADADRSAAADADTDWSARADRSADAVRPSWDAADGTALNLLCMAAWALANFAGAAVGDVLAIPTAVASFAMTSIFICLLFARRFTRPTVVCAVGASAGVVACKVLGLDQLAILAGALIGLALGATLGASGGSAGVADASAGDAGAGDARAGDAGASDARALEALDGYGASVLDEQRLEQRVDGHGESHRGHRVGREGEPS